jgi:hypothetical protein
MAQAALPSICSASRCTARRFLVVSLERLWARPDLVTVLSANSYSFGQSVNRLCCDEIWNIGVIDQTAEDIVRRGIVALPRWMPPRPSGRMLADPGFREHGDGSCRLYAEHLDYDGSGKGEIWYADLAHGEDLIQARFRPLIAFEHHASYPFPFTDDRGRELLTAETWQAGGALLWDEDAPAEAVGTLIPGPVVDPTLWRRDGTWWLFCSLRDRDPDGALFLFQAPELSGPWSAHPGNPVRKGRAGSRPAGPLFEAEGRLIRPGQDCSRTYGGGVILHEVTRLDGTGFEEAQVRRIDPVQGPYASGLHTICPAGAMTLIDGKSWRWNAVRAIRKLGGHLSRGRPDRARPAQP